MIETKHIIFMLAYSVWGLMFANNLYSHLHVEGYDDSGECHAAVYGIGFFLIIVSVFSYVHS